MLVYKYTNFELTVNPNLFELLTVERPCRLLTKQTKCFYYTKVEERVGYCLTVTVQLV